MIAESWYRADLRLIRRIQVTGAPPLPLPHHPKRSMRPHALTGCVGVVRR
jgi:hypothetical protein